MLSPKEQKVFVFIDSQNLNLGVSKSIFDKSGKRIYTGWKLDFDKFLRYIKDKYKVERALLFIGHIPENESLYRKLSSYGYDLIFKPTQKIRKGDEKTVKGNVDAELVLHTMINLKDFDKAIIVTGDGDFHCLIEYLVKNGKLLKLVIPNKHRYSSLLKEFSLYFDFVSTNRVKLEHKKRA